MGRGKSLAYKPGAGAERDYHAIKIFLDNNKLLIKDIAIEAEVHHSIVSHTIRGTKNNRRILRYLLRLGCPKNILSLPDDLKN